MVTIISVELDDTVDQMAHFAVASLCESHLADTAATPIVLFPFLYQGDIVWQQRLKAVSDPEGPHFHAAWLQWLSMHNAHSTCNTAHPRLSFSSVSV
jgi:hypothetical protein